MKKLLAALFCITTLTTLCQNYTWMHGSTATGQSGLYGTQGVSSATNDPGTRHGSALWTDAAGNLWLFGGEGNDVNNNFGWLNDLWKYTVSTNEWTWMGGSTSINATGIYGTQGVAAPSNFPGAREFSVTWVDASGGFWMFGGDGYAATAAFGRLGDLWKYDPATNQWTWVQGYNSINQNGIYGTQGTAGATVKPGSRFGAATWTDAQGKLWLFGGKGFDAAGASNYLNDLWRYDMTSNQWTWINGGTAVNQFGNYGTLLTPALSNQPGSREFPATWSTATGELYLFGGWGYTGNASGYLNDLWKYNPTTNTWTWVHGGNSFNQTGTYGTLGVESALNMPGGRLSPAAWKDDAGMFWLFGGDGFSSAGSGQLNDLFKYNSCTNQWTWMKGNNIADQNAVYGTMTVSNPANTPGGRQYNNYWKGKGNTLWLSGGFGFGSGALAGNLNDLWKFEPPCFHSTITINNSSICSGRTLSLSLGSVCEGTVSWYNSPTATTPIGSGNNYTTTLLAASSQSIYTIYAEAYSCTVSPRGAITITVNTTPTVVITPSLLCEGITTTLTLSGAATYTWDGVNANSMVVFPVAPSYDFTLQGTAANSCTSNIINTVTVNTLPVITINTANSLALCLNSAVTLTASGANSYTWNSGATSPVITVTPTTLNTNYTVTGANGFGCVSTAIVQQPVTAPPVLTVTPAAILCSGNANVLTADGAVSYTWNGTAGTSTLAVTPALPAVNFTLTGTDVNGCSTDTTGIFAVNISPTLALSTSAPDYLCRFLTATLTAVSSATTYTWSNNQIGATATVSPFSTTTYTVIGTSANGCQDTASIRQKVVICLSIKNNGSASKQVILYPNPNTGEFVLSLEEAGSAQLVIYTVLGQQLTELSLTPGDNHIRTGLAKGLYYYQVQNAGNTLSSGRLLVE